MPRFIKDAPESKEEVEERVSDRLKLSLDDIPRLNFKDFCNKVVAPLYNRGPLDYPHLEVYYDQLPNLQPGDTALYLDPRGHLKCVSKGTIIQMANGELKPIENIEIGDEVIGYDSSFNPVVSKVLDKESKLSKTFEFKFRSGRSIHATAEHKFLNLDSYTTFPRYCAIPRILEIPKPTKCNIDEDDIKLITYLITEGCLVSNLFSFTNGISKVMQEFKEIANRKGWKWYHVKDIEIRLSGGCRDWARKWGLYDKSSFEKKFPDNILSLPIEKLRIVIERLWATDGSIIVFTRKDMKKQVNITYCSVNFDLVSQIQTMLTRWGIYSTIYNVATGYKKNGIKIPKSAYYLSVDGNENKRKFVHYFNIIGKNTKHIKEYLNTTSQSNCYSERFNNDIRKHIVESQKELRVKGVRIDNTYKLTRNKIRRIPSISHYANINVNWDDLNYCIEFGNELVYDIETSTGNYIANGLIVHNSTLGAVGFPCWKLMSNSELRFLITSAKADQARADLYGAKMILDFLGKRPDSLEVGKGRWSQSAIILERENISKEPSIMAAGVDSGTVSFHFDYIIGDDLHDQENIGAKGRKSVRRFWNDAIMGIMEPSTITTVYATRWHYDDIYGDFLKQKWKGHVRQVWVKDLNVSCPVVLKSTGKVCGEHHRPLFPAKFSADYIHNNLITRQTPSSFAMQFLNDPAQASTAIFKAEWLTHYNPENIAWNLSTFGWRTYQAVDLMTSEDVERSDYFVSMIMSANNLGEFYIRDIIRQKCDLFTKIKLIKQQYDLYHPSEVLIDSTANQIILSQFLKDPRFQFNFTLPICEVKNRERKTMRIEALEPFHHQKRILVNMSAPWYEEYKLEYMEYSGEESAHDDQLDCEAMLMEKFSKTGGKPVIMSMGDMSYGSDRISLHDISRGRAWMKNLE